MIALPYRNLYVGIIEILKDVFENQQYTDKKIEKTFKENRLWGSRDRSFVASTVYDLVRWKRLVDFSSSGALRKNNYWDFVAAWFVINEAKLPDFKEFKNINYDKIRKSYKEAVKIPAIWHSISDELYEIGKAQLGEQWNKELEEMNQPAPAILRVNLLKTTPKELVKSLRQEGFELDSLSGYPYAYVLQEKGNIFRTEAFKKGWFEMQDASSQLVAPFLEAKPTMRVADVCAGAGGKTLHLANLMENKGQLVAMDVHNWKLKELKRRAKRNGIHNITIKLVENNKVLKRFAQSFDRVLIDAPCSGLGVLKRNPDAKWKIGKVEIDRVVSLQGEILETYSKLLKNNGLLVYATCSILPCENREQVDKFLSKHTDFEFIEEKKIYPSETGFDGFYMTKMRRK